MNVDVKPTLADGQLIAAPQRMVSDPLRLIVEERTVGRGQIDHMQGLAAVLETGVIARHAVTGQYDVVVAAAADGYLRPVQHVPAAEVGLHRGVDHDQTIHAQGPALQLFERGDPSLVIVAGFHATPRC